MHLYNTLTLLYISDVFSMLFISIYICIYCVTLVRLCHSSLVSLRRLATDVMLVDSNGDRPLQPNYIVLITDGQSDNRSLTWKEAMRARARGITILVVRR